MMTVRFLHRALSIATITCVAILGPGVASADEVNIYSTREPGLVEPLFNAFTEKTGITINTLFLKDGMAERIAAEGVNSPADLLMTVDIGKLINLAEMGLTQSIGSDAIEAAIPTNLRDAGGHWFALSLRARVIYAAADLELASFTYEELSDPQWRGRVCIRSGQHPYNTALFAAFLARHGTAATEEWLTGIKANLGRRSGGGDRDVARDILGKICDIGPANSYYVGLMRSGAGGPEQLQWGAAIKVVLPTFDGGGTHVNISGAAVAKNAPNRDAAVKLLEFLVSNAGQKLYADANYEYPVKAGVAPNEIIAALGRLNVDSIALDEIANHRKAASELVDKVGFDN